MKKGSLLVSLLIFSVIFVFNACSSGGNSGGGNKGILPPAVRYIGFAAENPVVPAMWEAGEPEEDGTNVFFVEPDTSYVVKAAVFAGDMENTDVSDEYGTDAFVWNVASGVRTAILSRDGKSMEMRTGANGYATISLTVTDVGIFTFKVKDKVYK